MQYVITNCRQKRGVPKKRSTDRKFRNKMGHVCEEYGFYIDKDHIFKRSRHQVEIYEYLVVTSEHIKYKGGFLNVLHRVRQ